MRILVHICCGPCSIYVLQRLLSDGHEITGFFYNPNIHPLAEYMRRRQGAQEVCLKLSVPLVCADTLEPAMQGLPGVAAVKQVDSSAGTQNGTPFFGIARPSRLPELPEAAAPYAWLQAVAGRVADRCGFCWGTRLAKTAWYAQTTGFEAITSTLLYSRYQDHATLMQLGAEQAKVHDIGWHYKDFREGWQQGITLSKEWGIYRQGYCGCVYSEYERFARDMQKLVRASG